MRKQSEDTPFTELRAISSTLADFPSQAKFVRLAGLVPPPLESGFFDEATAFVQEQVYASFLSLSLSLRLIIHFSP